MTTELKLATVTLDNEIVARSRTQINCKNCILKKEFLDIFTNAIYEPNKKGTLCLAFYIYFKTCCVFAFLCKICQKDASLDYLHHAMLLLLGEELIRKCGWLSDMQCCKLFYTLLILLKFRCN